MHRLTLAALLAVATLAPAQNVRFELGQRLRAFERELDKPGMAAKRKLGLDPLVQATPSFFSGQLPKAAGLLDRARLLIATDGKPTDAALWANSLVANPDTRFAAAGSTLKVRVEAFYKVAAAAPDKATARVSLLGAGGKSAATATAPLGKLPADLSLPLAGVKEGDYALRTEILVADKVEATGEQTLSVAADIPARLKSLKDAVAAAEKKNASTEKATLSRLVTLLGDLANKETLETNYPAARLLKEAENLADAVKKETTYYGPDRPGQFWLTLSSAKGSDIVRVQIPPGLKKGTPVPLVVAMHGAGGSENMFFDGYGDGAVAKLAAKRGWLLVTTRTPLLGFGGPDVARVVESLSGIYPVDAAKVMLVGHSMGASQAVANAGRMPKKILAVAALGGGGNFARSEDVKSVRFFVGVGDKDFALTGSKALASSVEKAGVKTRVFKTYENVEHLIVVQLALPEVFAFFDEAVKVGRE